MQDCQYLYDILKLKADFNAAQACMHSMKSLKFIPDEYKKKTKYNEIPKRN